MTEVVTFILKTAMKAHNSTLSLTSALDGSGWSTPRPGPFTSEKDTQYLFYMRLDGSPGSVLTGAENIVPTGIRSPDRPARSKSLFRLRYPGLFSKYVYNIIQSVSIAKSVLLGPLGILLCGPRRQENMGDHIWNNFCEFSK